MVPLLLFTGLHPYTEEDTLQTEQSEIDSLQQIVLLQGVEDTLKVRALIGLSWRLKSTDPDRAMGYAREALSLAEDRGYYARAGQAMNNIGIIFWQKGNFAQALDHFFESYHLFSHENDSLGIARAHVNIGMIFYEQGHYDKALEYYLDAYSIYEKADYLPGLGPVLNNIGLVYQDQGNYEEAEAYHLRSLAIKESLEDRKGIAFSYNGLGLVRQEMGDLDQALAYFNQALAIRETLLDSRELAVTIDNIGYLLLLKGDIRPALDHFSRAMRIYSAIDDDGGLARIHSHFGKAYFATGRTMDAVSRFRTSLEYAQTVGLPALISENLLDLSVAMAEANDFRSAYNYQSRYLALRDSIYDEEAQRRLIEMQFMYNREQKEREIELLKRNNEMIQVSLDQQNRLKKYLLFVIALVVGLMGLLYNRYRYIIRANKLLREQKEEIFSTNQKLQELNRHLRDQKKEVEDLNMKLNAANEKLSVSEQHLIATNVTKDKFFSIISHDLRNPFASIVSFSRILKRDINNLSKAELNELVEELDMSVLKINNLLENLLQWSRTQSGKIKYLPESISLSEVVMENVTLFSATAREKEVSISNHIGKDLSVWADRNMIDTVIRNLLSNALKYTHPGGSVRLDAEKSGQMVSVSISDTGVGIGKKEQSKVFRGEALHSTYGTRDEKGSGLGLLLCKEFVERLGGQIGFDSEPGRGSRFTFTIPHKKTMNPSQAG